MSRADWRTPGAYGELRSLNAPGFAWEYLRSNSDFQQDRRSSNEPPAAESWTKPRPTRSPGAGGCDFASGTETSSSPTSVLWAAHALPGVIAPTTLPDDLASPGMQLSSLHLDSSIAVDVADHLVEHRGTVFRVHVDEAGTDPFAALLALDGSFEIRVAAAVRLWRSLIGRNAGPNPAALSKTPRDRLILALRAHDGRLHDATYRETSSGVSRFSPGPRRPQCPLAILE